MAILEQIGRQIADARPVEFWPWVVGLAGFVLFSFVGAFYYLRRARLIEDTPTAKIRSAPQGYVELEGWALPGERGLQSSPLGGGGCLWWEFEVSRREQSGSRGGERWHTIERGCSQTRFLLEDDTGRCIVDPKGALVTTDLTREWHGSGPRPSRDARIGLGVSLGSYRYRERMIMAGEKLYVLGGFITDHRVPGDIPSTPGDGVGTVHIVAKPAERQAFVISTRPQRALVRYYRGAASSSFAGFLAGGAGLVWLLMARGMP